MLSGVSYERAVCVKKQEAVATAASLNPTLLSPSRRLACGSLLLTLKCVLELHEPLAVLCDSSSSTSISGRSSSTTASRAVSNPHVCNEP